MKKVNLLRLRHWCFPGKFNNFSEAATGGVLWEKLLLKISQYSKEKMQSSNFIKNRLQHKCFPRNIAKLLRTSISKNIC